MSFKSKICILVFLPCLILSGCVAVTPLNHKELEAISSLAVARTPTPNLKVITFTRAVLGASVGFVLMGPAGAGVAQTGARMAGKDEDQIPIKDFGQLVLLDFSERLQNEIANWPVMEIKENPVMDISSLPKPSLILSVNRFDLVYLGAFKGNGLVCDTHAVLKDSEGNVQWEINYFYSSADFKRGKEMDEFTRDNGKVLNEEIEFAAEQAVSDFLNHIKNSK